MNAPDVLALSGSALWRQKRRTLLSLLGVSIGVAAVLLLTSLGEGARLYVRGQFETLGTNLLAVLPGKTETTGSMPGFVAGVPNDLTLADAEALRRGMPAARHVAPVALGNETVSRGERSRQVLVAGSTAEFQPIRSIEMRTGSFLPELPWDRGAPVTVLGSKLADELFDGEQPIGQVVRIGSWRMKVIGVLKEQGMHLGIDMDEAVFVPVTTAMRMFNRSSLFRVVFTIGARADIDAAQKRCTEILVARHGEEDFTLITQDSVMDALSSILTMLTVALGGIAAISLAVAGLGIMNVMLVSVSERIEEIGLLKAVGAGRAQILSLFLAEAVMLSLLGGLIGLGLGFGLIKLARVIFPVFPATAPPWATVAAVTVSVIVGVFFGVLPARRASRLDPVAALQRREA